MHESARRGVLIVGVAAAAVALSAPTIAGRAATTFATPVQLGGHCGGEPSIDTDGHGHVYVSSPKGILAGVASCEGALSGTTGAATWASSSDAISFGGKVSAGTANGGGDTDTTVDQLTGDVYLADLEAVGSDICVSHDHGVTWLPFPNPTNAETCTAGNAPNVTAANQSGFEADRQWLNVYGPTATYAHKDVYLIYHDFAAGVPLVYRSQDGGAFTPLPPPAFTDATFTQQVANGTVMAKPVLDAAGNIYALVTTQGAGQGPLNHLWLIKSTDHGATWTDTSIFAGAATSQLGLVFNDLAIDGAGNLYALSLGNKDQAVPPVHAYLFTSPPGGASWSAPVDLNSSGKALALPALHGGPAAGQLVLGWYRSTNTTDPNDIAGQWVYDALESTNATSATPQFSPNVLGSVSHPGTQIVHQGQICTQGLLCTTGQVIGGGQGNRNLADFTSVTVDQNGCAIFTYADDGAITADQANYNANLISNNVTRQTGGCFAAAVPASNAPEVPALWMLLPVAGLSVALYRRTRRLGGPQAEI